jgi:hypothetical protein
MYLRYILKLRFWTADEKEQRSELMVKSFARTLSALHFLMNQILICFRRSQILELCHIFKEPAICPYTHCINKAILCTGSNDVDYISEAVLNSLD